MEESILISVKKMLGIDEDCVDFDTDIIININTVMSMLNQMGVGPEEGFIITGRNETWDSIYTDKRLSMVEEYVKVSVQLAFDPPTNQSMISILEKTISKLEFRIGVVVTDIENKTGGAI